MNLLESLYLLESTFLAPSGAIKHGYGCGKPRTKSRAASTKWVNGSIYLDHSRYLFTQLSLYLGLWSNPINGGFNVLVATSSTQLADLEKDHATQEALHSALPLLIQESDPKLIKLYILSNVFFD